MVSAAAIDMTDPTERSRPPGDQAVVMLTRPEVERDLARDILQVDRTDEGVAHRNGEQYKQQHETGSPCFAGREAGWSSEG